MSYGKLKSLCNECRLWSIEYLSKSPSSENLAYGQLVIAAPTEEKAIEIFKEYYEFRKKNKKWDFHEYTKCGIAEISTNLGVMSHDMLYENPFLDESDDEGEIDNPFFRKKKLKYKRIKF